MTDLSVEANASNLAHLVVSSTSKQDVISSLEDRYIKLLEAKIAHLESQLVPRKLDVSTAKNGSAHDEAASEIQTPTNVSNLHSPQVGHFEHKPEYAQKASQPDQYLDEVPGESRYQIVLTEWDPHKGQFEEQPLPDLDNDTQFGPITKPNRAFTFRKLLRTRDIRRLPGDEYPSSSEVDVVFPELQKLLGRITYKWGWAEEVTACASPYSALVYSWEEAQTEANAVVDGELDDEKQAREDLKELLRIISTSSGDVRLDRYFKNRQALLNEVTITHEALWTLFPPGTLIVGQPCNDEIQVFVVLSSSKFVSDSRKFMMVCFSFDWDGTTFNRVPFEVEFEPWGGERKSVTSLPFYPLEFYEKEGLSREESREKLEKRLIERGQKFVKVCTAPKGKQMFNYSNGPAYFHRGGTLLKGKYTDSNTGSSRDSSPSSDLDDPVASAIGIGASWKPIEGAVIVDFASYLTYQSARGPILGPLSRYAGFLTELTRTRRTLDVFKNMYKLDWDGTLPGRTMSYEQLLCCPPRVLGYALNQKRWVQLLVRYLIPPNKADDSTFRDRLQLDSDAKDLIYKSVKAHATSGVTSKDGLSDFAPGKGKGLVIMLYGQPGVGKTLTAESVAQMTSKPLLSVGVSDIGTEGDKVELNFQRIFALAGLWEAVLLFDEADVFLEARGEGDNDLQRNAMVSDLAIKFTELQSDQKIAIYNSFLEQLDNKGLVDDLDDLQRWAKKEGKRYKFNGRQIRNVLSTALGLARAEGKKLRREDLISVAQQTDEFKQDLHEQEAIYRDRQITQRT